MVAVILKYLSTFMTTYTSNDWLIYIIDWQLIPNIAKVATI